MDSLVVSWYLGMGDGGIRDRDDSIRMKFSCIQQKISQ